MIFICHRVTVLLVTLVGEAQKPSAVSFEHANPGRNPHVEISEDDQVDGAPPWWNLGVHANTPPAE